jgi:SpoVK/Ycf46/Vps4 family AAA+-type ATPase
VDSEAVKALEATTSLALERPALFEYGIRLNHRITGALLYGPLGTGKTMLAQAVAKTKSFTMFMISSGDILQKEVGEEEEDFRAAFSSARKLYPCIMFVDEVDGLLRTRQSDDKKY